jgi:hypothetical protein
MYAPIRTGIIQLPREFDSEPRFACAGVEQARDEIGQIIVRAQQHARGHPGAVFLKGFPGEAIRTRHGERIAQCRCELALGALALLVRGFIFERLDLTERVPQSQRVKTF